MPEDTTVRINASPVGSLKLRDIQIPVVDPHGVQVVAADLITEAREFNGVCALSLATLVVTPNAEGQGSAEAVVCARLRFSVATALDIRNSLDNLLKQSMPPKSEAH